MEIGQKDKIETCDLLVVGSGAAGLAAAVTAAHQGLNVVLAEKAPVLGGTTAWSGGWIWAPCNPVSKRHGIKDSSAAARLYLEGVLGKDFNEKLVDAFLAAAPQMVDFFERETALSFECGIRIADTYGHLQGAGTGGRSLIAQPYHGRKLGAAISSLRRPLRETTFWGLTIQAGADLRAFMSVTRSIWSALYVMRRMCFHLWDLLLYRRGMQLRNGNALVARLLRSALDLNVDVRTFHSVTRLLTKSQAVEGAIIEGPDGEIAIKARCGVVLAAGGYPQDQSRRAKTFPRPETHQSVACDAASGDGLKLGEQAGGVQALNLASAGAWCPVSQVFWPDGKTGIFPHIIDRGKPGVIGVLANGKRFCNEGLGYHDYVCALLDAVPKSAKPESWLICDHHFLRRYGLGIVRPVPIPFGGWLKMGYLKKGKTIEDLARACGIDPDGLNQTVTRFNHSANAGGDPEYGRGSTPYMQLQGDVDVVPNPCVAPIQKPPFYAVKVLPGSFGTFAGLRTDGSARVLNSDNVPITGLYAAGTDMASVMGGHYPAGGINLGPALTFGFIAGRHAAQSSA